MKKSMWREDNRPSIGNNTIEKEIERLKRVITALRCAVENGKKQHIMNDINELDLVYMEMCRLLGENSKNKG